MKCEQCQHFKSGGEKGINACLLRHHRHVSNKGVIKYKWPNANKCQDFNYKELESVKATQEDLSKRKERNKRRNRD